MKTLQSLWCKNWPQKRVPNSWCKSTKNEFLDHPYIIVPGGFVQYTGELPALETSRFAKKKNTLGHEKTPSTPGVASALSLPVPPPGAAVNMPPTDCPKPSIQGWDSAWMAEDGGNHMFYPKKNQVSFERWGLKIPGDTWGIKNQG